MRTFMFSYAQCWGEVGGSSGVNYKLYLSNKKYKKIDNLYHVFMNRVIEPDKLIEKISNSDGLEKKMKSNKLLKFCKKFLKQLSAADIIAFYRKLHKAKKWIWQMHKKYEFTDEDRFLFHDIISAYAFLKLFAMKSIGLVYHQQGSLYAEWNAQTGIEAKGYHLFLNSIMEKTFNKVHILAFPSLGAREALYNSEPFLKKFVKPKVNPIVYNGFDRPDFLETSKEIIELVEKIDPTKKVFITVASLNYAKGVERIPEFLAYIKQNKWDFVWIIIGMGEMERRLQEEILHYDIKENVVWLKRFLKHDDILKLFSISDFYLLFHRWSIFDFSTIEAMAYGVVPILTPVGGNLEMIQDGLNGFFAKEPYDQIVDRLSALINNNELEKMKEKNVIIQQENFNCKSFLEGYQDLLKKLEGHYETVAE